MEGQSRSSSPSWLARAGLRDRGSVLGDGASGVIPLDVKHPTFLLPGPRRVPFFNPRFSDYGCPASTASLVTRSREPSLAVRRPTDGVIGLSEGMRVRRPVTPGDRTTNRLTKATSAAGQRRPKRCVRHLPYGFLYVVTKPLLAHAVDRIQYRLSTFCCSEIVNKPDGLPQ